MPILNADPKRTFGRTRRRRRGLRRGIFHPRWRRSTLHRSLGRRRRRRRRQCAFGGRRDGLRRRRS